MIKGQAPALLRAMAQLQDTLDNKEWRSLVDEIREETKALEAERKKLEKATAKKSEVDHEMRAAAAAQAEAAELKAKADKKWDDCAGVMAQGKAAKDEAEAKLAEAKEVQQQSNADKAAATRAKKDAEKKLAEAQALWAQAQEKLDKLKELAA
jgi:chromosome segregation ATPase